MPRKSDSGKPSALSEEYVVDSSDNENGDEQELEGFAAREPLAVEENVQRQSSRDRSAAPESVQSISSSKKRRHDASPESLSKKMKKQKSSTRRVERSSQSTARATIEPTVLSPQPEPQSSSTVKRKSRSRPPPPVARTIPAKTFEAPTGFSKASKPIMPTDPVADFLESLKNSGTELWHITAPASLPISSIKEINLQAIDSEEPVTNHKGIDYYLIGPNHQKPRVFFPGSANAAFGETSHRVAKTLAIKPAFEESATLMELIDGSWTPGAAKTAPRPTPGQPHALLRYKNRPFGVAAAARESDVFRVPTGAVQQPLRDRDVNGVSSSQASGSTDDAFLREEKKRRKKQKRRGREKEGGSVEV